MGNSEFSDNKAWCSILMLVYHGISTINQNEFGVLWLSTSCSRSGTPSFLHRFLRHLWFTVLVAKFTNWVDFGKLQIIVHTRWCPPVTSWFIIPSTIDISTISPIYWNYQPTSLTNWGTTLYVPLTFMKLINIIQHLQSQNILYEISRYAHGNKNIYHIKQDPSKSRSNPTICPFTLPSRYLP